MFLPPILRSKLFSNLEIFEVMLIPSYHLHSIKETIEMIDCDNGNEKNNHMYIYLQYTRDYGNKKKNKNENKKKNKNKNKNKKTKIYTKK